jgi:serine/threonine protein kinase
LRAEEMIDLLRGNLPPDRLDDAAGHLEQCPACEEALSRLADAPDRLVAGLRDDGLTELHFDRELCRRLEERARAIPSSAPTPAMPAPSPPSTVSVPPTRSGRLGPYRLLRELSAGGMGVVYEAWHTKLQRRVALKTLRPDWMHDSRMVARFHREMAAVGRLDHPNIVRATDADELDGLHFLIMDFVDGLDLNEIVRLGGPLKIADACETARRAALALDYIHGHGMVHRDVKPSNLMLTRDGEVKLLDLGLALLYEGAAVEEASEAGQRLGTANYMAPEQARDPHRVDIRADLYSLGCTLYKLLTGQTPVARTTEGLGFGQALAPAPSVEMTPVYIQRPDAPPELTALLDRLLHHDPAKRFAEPEEVARLLQPLAAGANLSALMAEVAAKERAAGVRSSAAPDARPTPLLAPPATKRMSWTAKIIIAGLLLAAVAAAVLTFIFRPWSPPQTAKDNLDWPADYPQALRDRPIGARVELLRPAEQSDRPADPAQGEVMGSPGPHYQALWCRRLRGEGLYWEMNLNLQLAAGPTVDPTGCTVLALDDDRRRRWFDFEAEVEPSQGAWVEKEHFGVFFGWNKGPDDAGAYFVQLEHPIPDQQKPAPSRVVVRRLTSVAAPDVLKGDVIAEAEIDRPSSIYHVRVRAAPGQVAVRVNDEPPITFAPTSDPRGPLGLWVQDGMAEFRKAAVTALPDQAPSP